MQDLKTIFIAMGLYKTVDTKLSTVFFIKPLKQDNTICRDRETIFIPTHWLCDQLLKALDHKMATKKVELYHELADYPTTRLAAGWIFEAILHKYLVCAKSIHVQWCGKTSPQDIKLHSPTPIYWCPDNPGVNGAIITRDHVYVLQVTISHQHSTPQLGVDKLWHAMSQDRRVLEWKLLFVGDVESQSREVSELYADGLMVGDEQTREEGRIPRHHLPVGWFSYSPGKVSDTMVSVSHSLHHEGFADQCLVKGG